MMISKLLFVVTILDAALTGTSTCKKNEFPCLNGDCISIQKYCNGVPDCGDASDEKPNCTPCNISYYGVVGRTYELEVKRPPEVPFLCYLNFTAGGGVYGELVQVSFEAFSLGTFESFTTAGCPDGYIQIKEVNRPSLGGKWCGGSWGFTVYYSETSSINVTLALNRITQQQSSGYSFEFRISYKFLKLSDARLRYGNQTQRTYRGKLNVGSYCDRLLEGCSRRNCRVQSPNYPGIYPRNVTCHYRIREKNVLEGKYALIAIRQSNYHNKNGAPKFDNNEKMLRVWDQCNTLQNYVEFFDGWSEKATSLARLCAEETIPEIISSGPELLIKFHTSPYGNPFHPVSLSHLPGFELEIRIIYVNKETPAYIEPGKKCDFLISSFDNNRGLLESPLHSLPANTTCHYHLRGQPKDIVWISFLKYHVNNEKVNDFNAAGCDVQLEIWDGDIKGKTPAQLIGQFCKDDKPKLCDHALLGNSSRLTRPCSVSESYVSTSSDMTITHSIKYPTVLDPVHFSIRYEFIDLSQDGSPMMDRGPCNRLFAEPKGRFASPKITFLYGRGGQSDLHCVYQLEAAEPQNMRVVFNKAAFGRKECRTEYNPELNRWQCNTKSQLDGKAMITISEYPWTDVELKRHCLCSNISDEPFSITTKATLKLMVKFTVTNMKNTEDFNSYFFDATYEFLPNDDNCFNPWKSRRLKGSSGEISIRNDKEVGLEDQFHLNRTIRYCLQQPWLIEPEEDYNFLYLKIKGHERRDSRLCTSTNRILVYPAGHSEDFRIICPDYKEVHGGSVELFSEGWSRLNYKKLQNRNARSFIVEFLKKEPGNFIVTWMEISKNPALALASTFSSIRPPDCLHSCPELGACISPKLWCDGLPHCPSGNDEQEANCAVASNFLYAHLNSIALGAIAFVVTATVVIVIVVIIKSWRRDRRNVIVSVTEHTFLEFKSGLC